MLTGQLQAGPSEERAMLNDLLECLYVSANQTKRLIMCDLLDNPLITNHIESGTTNGKGDYADQFTQCGRCWGWAHRDNHMYGDGVWRHE